jgi:O-succinylbenzoate synthase
LRIEKAELRVLEMPLVHPFRTSFGTETVRTTVLVTLYAEGLAGWGESPVSRFPGYSYETAETAVHVLGDFLLPSLVATQPPPAPGEWEAFHRVRGHPMAKCGLEAALSDLAARARGVSLSDFLGGERREIAVGVSIGIQPTVDDLVRRVRGFVEEGYGRVKLKIEPGWDVDVVERVRGEFPDLPLWVDANQAYPPDESGVFQRLDGLDLGLIEQPYAAHDFPAHARLAEALGTPVCLDEGVESTGQFQTAVALGACGILNIKSPRVGGLTVARALHDAARETGVPVWCGGMLETGVGRLANIALASLPHFVLPGDISESRRYFQSDIIDPPVVLGEGGTIAVPRGPGIGAEVDLDAVERFTARKATFR